MYQLLRHHVSVCPLLLPLPSSHTPGTFLPFVVKGQLFSKPKPADPIQKRKLRRCGEWHARSLACAHTRKHHSTRTTLPVFWQCPPTCSVTIHPPSEPLLFPLYKTLWGRDVCVTFGQRRFTFGHEMDTVCVVLPRAFCSNCIVS